MYLICLSTYVLIYFCIKRHLQPSGLFIFTHKFTEQLDSSADFGQADFSEGVS